MAAAVARDLKLDLAMPKGLDAARAGDRLDSWRWLAVWQQKRIRKSDPPVGPGRLRGRELRTIALAPKHMFPAQIEDCKCAVRWLRTQRREATRRSRADRRRRLLGRGASGDAAGHGRQLRRPGGHRRLGRSVQRVKAVVSYAGPTDLKFEFPIASNKLVADFLGGPPDDKHEVARAASPIDLCQPGRRADAVDSGNQDPLVPYDQAYKMAEALTKASVPGRVELLLGEGHGWPKEHARVIAATFEFLDRHLKP